jgi:geranylgeranyl pyrophosphate synthase
MPELRTLFSAAQLRAEAALERSLAGRDDDVSRLLEAMRYSVLGGGKRLRPVLVYLTGDALGAAPASLDAPAAAVELIHAYSLVHDDLPAMDDDDLRRGRPSCHKAYDEGTAVLAGDALQALAFGVLGRAEGLDAAARLEMLLVLADAIGTSGMAGGQAMDLAAEGRPLTADELQRMHRRKTGALICASVELGAIAAGRVQREARAALVRYGEELGLAFQIQDDILDVTGETEVLGKRAGADAALNKPTYPSILGLERSRELASAHCQGAIDALTGLGPAAAPLAALARYVVERAS